MKSYERVFPTAPANGPGPFVPQIKAEEVRELRGYMMGVNPKTGKPNMTQRQFGAVWGRSKKMILEYENGQSPVQEPLNTRMQKRLAWYREKLETGEVSILFG